MAGWFGALTLLVLPGSWPGFGLELPGASFRARVALSVVLSPVALLLQFYLLRWAGLGFRPTTIALVVLNLPALLLVAHRRRDIHRPVVARVAAWLLPVGLVGAYLGTWIRDPQVRGNWGHAWTHTDITYLLANGQLRPEEPMLAGVALAYPWPGHAVHAILSRLLDWAPNASYVLLNVVLLLGIMALVAELVGELSGGPFAEVASAVLLAFGTNFVGVTGRMLLPGALLESYPIWGDPRYSPWIRKFGVFQQDPFGIAFCAALAYLGCQLVGGKLDRSRLLLIPTLLTALAFFYPILWPAAAALVGGTLLALGVRPREQMRTVPGRVPAFLLGSLVLGGAVLVAWMALVTVDRGGQATMGFHTGWEAKMRVATAGVVLLPLWAAVVAGPKRLWRERRPALVVLGAGAACALGLNVTVHIYNWTNEYKYIFVAALCLAPVAGIGVERIRRALPGSSGLIFVLLGVLLAAPPTYNQVRWYTDMGSVPQLDLSSFDARLRSGQPNAALLDAIRTASPPQAVLISKWLPFDITTLAQRALYVPATGGPDELWGTGLAPDFLLTQTRGYAPAVVRHRREIQQSLFEAESDAGRSRQLALIEAETNRPLVVILELPADTALNGWLDRSGASSLYRAPDATAWLVPAPPVHGN